MKICIRCKQSYPESFFYKRSNTNKLRAECKNCFSDSRRNYYLNNKPKIQARIQRYYQDNKQSINSYKSQWQKDNSEKRRIRLNERYRTEPKFKVAVNLRSRVLKALQNNQKTGSTLDILGCSIDFFVKYMESKFKPDMNWENHGIVWHIDHIKPCAKFDLSKEAEQRKCFHYTNMQPLYAKDNLSKGSK